MQLKVKTLTGNIIEVDVEMSHSIMDVKKIVEEKQGIPPEQQRLIYAGRAMNDEKTVEEHKIKAGDVVHLVLALRGGF